jgi:hypothetical protein
MPKSGHKRARVGVSRGMSEDFMLSDEPLEGSGIPEVPMVHQLKTWPESFQAVWNGLKKYELRKDDRVFKVGDGLFLREWDPMTEEYSNRAIQATVTYITTSCDFPGLQDEYVVMGLKVEVKGKAASPWFYPR